VCLSESDFWLIVDQCGSTFRHWRRNFAPRTPSGERKGGIDSNPDAPLLECLDDGALANIVAFLAPEPELLVPRSDRHSLAASVTRKQF
jgi:hypothetical protein